MSVSLAHKLRTRIVTWLAALLGCVLVFATHPFKASSAVSPKDRAATSPKDTRETEAKPQVSARPTLSKPAVGIKNQVPVVFQKSIPTSILDLQTMQQHVQTLVKKVSPSVVAVEIGAGSGSGVVISAEGLVLTAGHVCEEPGQDVRFTFPDGKTARGKTIGLGTNNDTGLMRITDSGPWPHVDMGEIESAHSGDWVLALGHPGGFDPGRSLVVRLGRIIRLTPALQTDCTISPGDSGGPVFDMYGRVIGIHSFISTAMVDNFHVPITAFNEDWQTMVAAEKAPLPPRGPEAFVGTTGVDDEKGYRIIAVAKEGPAFKAGLKVGDVVVEVEGRQILAAASFQRLIRESGPGETVNINIRRGTNALSLNVKLGAAKKGDGSVIGAQP